MFRSAAIGAMRHAAWGFLLVASGLAASAQSNANLVANGGFEESVTVNVTTNNEQYRLLLERGVDLPVGTNAVLPARCGPNPVDGWPGGSRLVYVEGVAGREVHAGRRAVRVVSPAGYSGLVVGRAIPVAEGMSLLDNDLQLNHAHKFTAWVKGQGSVMLKAYMYGDKGTNIYDYARCQTAQPSQLAVATPDRWQRIEGTFRINCPEVWEIVFVLGIQGDVTLDDVELTTE
jgi:hypothetical protein